MQKFSTFPQILFITGLFLTLNGCSTYRHGFNNSDSIDYGKYKTFAPMFHAEQESKSPLLISRLNNAISGILSEKGLSFNEINPDILFKFYVNSDINSAYGSLIDEKWRGVWQSEDAGVTVIEGLLVIDFFDPVSDTIIWRGWVSGLSGEYYNVLNSLNQAVQIVLKNYPELSK